MSIVEKPNPFCCLASLITEYKRSRSLCRSQLGRNCGACLCSLNRCHVGTSVLTIVVGDPSADIKIYSEILNTLQIIYIALFVPALISAITAEYQPSPANFAQPKRGIVDPSYDGPRDHRFRQSKPTNPRSIQGNNAKLSYYKDKPAPRDAASISSSAYEGGFKSPAPYSGVSLAVRQSEGQIKEPPYFGDLFTISSGYKVANEAVPVKQVTRHPNAGTNLVFPGIEIMLS